MQKFGEYIRKLRLDKNLTIRQLEELSGVSNSYLSQLENGKRSVPKPEILEKLADPLGVSYEQLMMEAGYLSDELNDKYFHFYMQDKEYELQDFYNKKIYDLLKRMSDEKGKFPLELHTEIFAIFGNYLTIYMDGYTDFNEMFEKYINEEKQKKDSDKDNMQDAFNKFYNRSTIMYSLINYRGFKKTHEDFLGELERLFNKHFEVESEFIESLDLSDEELFNKFKMILDGSELTPDEFQGVVAFVRANRQLKNTRK